MLPSASAGPDPYALARRPARKKKDETAAEAKPQEDKTAQTMQAMQDQLQKMQESLLAKSRMSQEGGVEGAEISISGKPTIVKGGVGMLMMSEDVEKRLKKIEEYLERLPGMDQRVMAILSSLTGTSAIPSTQTVLVSFFLKMRTLFFN